ncbi:MAG: antitoxin Xre/MbcA/ParS toxin-binding domain-containing protein [Bryobacteraceae bacterium]|jgi:uncharacterized protein (DUF2384 family)
MDTALKGLAPRDREILARFYLDEQSQDRICAEMGLTEAQFRLLKSRARARFSELAQKALARKRPPVTNAVGQAASGSTEAVDIERVLPTVAHAVAVFGDEQKASHWLATPLALLDNRSPAQILARGDVDAVDQILTRIEYNIPS